jgi:hypothetical protein
MSDPATEPDLTIIPLLADDPARYFQPIQNYALMSLPNAFEDMKATLTRLFSRHPGVRIFDATVFYSRRRPNLSAEAQAALAHYNHAAFGGAIKHGGLVVYYQGHRLKGITAPELDPALDLDFIPDCLSFCIWESRPLAVAGAAIAPHRKAAGMVGRWYTDFALKKLQITIGADGSIVFQEYQRNKL